MAGPISGLGQQQLFTSATQLQDSTKSQVQRQDEQLSDKSVNNVTQDNVKLSARQGSEETNEVNGSSKSDEDSQSRFADNVDQKLSTGLNAGANQGSQTRGSVVDLVV